MMMKPNRFAIAAWAAGIIAGTACSGSLHAEDTKDNAIERVMKTYHKAPKGTDPICKKAVDGTASPEELKKLVAGYKVLAATKPPQGELASWKQKTSKLLTAAQGLEKGGAEAQAKYKEAVNCKACHSVHKPD